MADMERAGQASLLSRTVPSALKADLLKYPHHGKTPLVEEFLRAVNPEAAVITNKTVSDWGGVRYLAAKGVPYIYTNQTGVYVTSVSCTGRTAEAVRLSIFLPAENNKGVDNYTIQ